ncbi:MAG: glycine cleavage system protein GcvH [Elusimicrobia bacterium]|nr:glycine cleavage system protein GcvH [Elusimicrobiota bacterium]
MPKAEELKYTKTHEWLFIEGNTAVAGLSEHAQKEIGDVVFVELPKKGRKVEKEKPCAVVESVKSAFDIYAPVSGEITELNESLNSEPALINQSPLENGWLFKLKISNPDETDSLMDYSSYQEFIKQNVH